MKANFRLIPLTKGFVAIVDPDDFQRLNQHSWQASVGGTGGAPYAVRTARIDGKKKTIRMHREIMNAPEGMEVDHKNGRTLDNRKAMLEVVTKKVNLERRRYA